MSKTSSLKKKKKSKSKGKSHIENKACIIWLSPYIQTIYGRDPFNSEKQTSWSKNK